MRDAPIIPMGEATGAGASNGDNPARKTAGDTWQWGAAQWRLSSGARGEDEGGALHHRIAARAESFWRMLGLIVRHGWR